MPEALQASAMRTRAVPPADPPLLGDPVVAAARRVAAIIARAWRRYLRRRYTRAIYGALYELDDRTLRDLGFHRCEIGSVVAEATGEAEWTRVRRPLEPRSR